MMKQAKVILEYVKTLIWPIVVVVALFMFVSELKQLLNRIQSIEGAGMKISAESGAPETEGDLSNGTRPQVWFSIRDLDLSQEDCEIRAKSALQATGFTNDLGITPTRTVYGYTEDLVGVIWCGDPTGSVLITVAGPSNKEVPSKQRDLAASFSELSP